MKVLVTGAAGFVGAGVMRALAGRGDVVTGIDNLNAYYDVRLKYGRLQECGFACGPYEPGVEYRSSLYPDCRFIRMSIEDKDGIDALFAAEGFDAVVNLAAQGGVRYSISNPYAYMQSNMLGFLNILEACRANRVSHLVFASSSSVYGMGTDVPYREDSDTDRPVSLYAATKKSNELMAHSYAGLYGIPSTGLRYFTVYGPWGRPDMAPMLFASAMTKGEPLKVFNGGDMVRDFTYIDDIVEGTVRTLDNPPSGETPYRIFNIGCSSPVRLLDFISELEDALGCTAVKEFLPMQKGDVYQTNADTSELEKATGYRPRVLLKEGVRKFARWYKSDKNPLR